MHGVTLLLIGLLGGGGASEYSRSLSAKSLDQATLDAEGFGEKKSFKRDDDGLRITLAPGDQETGWKTPPQLKVGGDFTISANFVIKTLPKPAQEDGVAIGLAIAFQDINQPDVTLVRLREPNDSEVYRSIERATNNPQQQQMQQQRFRNPFQQPGGMPAKPPRHTFPAAGETVRMELQREGSIIRLQVLDGKTGQARYIGQVSLGTNDVAAVKLFASNRNGAEAVNVLLRDVSIHADRISGLGTTVRTVFDKVIYGEPTSIEDGVLIVGGQPKTPAPTDPKVPEGGAPAAPANAPAAPGNAPAPTATAAAPATAAAAPATAPDGGSPAAASPAPGEAATKATVAESKEAPKDAATAPARTDAQADKDRSETSSSNAADVAKKSDGPPNGQPAAAPQPPKPAEPKARIPLDEVDSIRFERTTQLAGRFLGQVNLDFTMPGLSAKKDEAAAAKKDEAAPKKDDAAPKKDEAAAAKKDEAAPKKDEAAPKKDEAAPKKDETAATKKDEAAPKKDEAAPKKNEAAPKGDSKTAKGEANKTAGDDVLAPPPGTTAVAKVARVEPKKNGIRDLNLSLSGLRSAAIKQITVTCQTDRGPTSWRLDTTDSQDWPLVVRRGGTEAWADLFLEPPPGDCHQKDFVIAVTYADGQAANTTVKATEHTDASLAVDSIGPAVARPDVWVHLTGDEKLFGKLEGLGEETLKLTTPWQDHLDVPLTRVIGIHFGLLDRKESPESFAKRLQSRGTEDLLLAQTKNGEVLAIPGVVEGMDKDKLNFLHQGKSRTLPLQQVEGLIMAARPDAKQPDALPPTFTFPSGIVVSGKWIDFDPSIWKVETAWGQELKLPALDVQSVRFRGGKMMYLSDLSPSKVEQTPFFGRQLPWRRDVGLMGEPLKMSGQTYDHGVAVHSRCVLTYDLEGRYTTFEALVGFEDSAKGKGRVDCRVFADGKELYSNPDLRADGPPVKLDLKVAGAEQLRLLVDFGRGQDTGDRVIWGNARLYRRPPAEAAAATPASSNSAEQR